MHSNCNLLIVLPVIVRLKIGGLSTAGKPRGMRLVCVFEGTHPESERG